MLPIALRGKRALVAGVADDGGFGFAIAKALANAGATVCVGTWPPALTIFKTMLERGKMDASAKMTQVDAAAGVKCYGVNACKGHNDCATAENSCKGAGSCKGKGYIVIPASTCADVGGTTKS